MFVPLAASNFSDPTHARIIDLSVMGLIGLAVAVLVATIIWWRATRGEHPALGTLEVMGTRRFVTADPERRHEVLAKVRVGSGSGDDDLIVVDHPEDAPASPDMSDDDDLVEVADAGVATEADDAPASEPPAPVAEEVAEFLHEFADLLPDEAADEHDSHER